MVCQICHTSGDNWKKCKKCGVVFCTNSKCVKQRFGLSHRAGNQCPQCGSLNCLTRP